jgi:UDP-N-acetylmuramate--alanine ligase
MSGLARIYLDRGCRISGSDLNHNRLTDFLRNKGAVIYRGHDPSNIPEDSAFVVKSTCIRDNNPEIIRSKELGIPVILRGELLERTLNLFTRSFAVTGTHGKTTTSSLIAHILERTGMDPTVLVGGEVSTFKGNAKTGKSGYFVAEVDESDGYFRNLSSRYAVITNIEREHMEYYASMRNLKDSYGRFIDNIPEGGILAVNGEDATIKEVLQGRNTDTVTFGIDGGHDVTCGDLSFAENIDFELIINGFSRGRINSALIGRYNVMNILAAMAVLCKTGLNIDKVKEAVSSFPGVKRRFEKIGKIGNIEVVEDYAHHPTEIKSVIQAASRYAAGRVITVFQPHRYSRTVDLLEEFKECFYDTDLLVLTDIYSAHEDRIEGISAGKLFEGMRIGKNGGVNFLAKDSIPRFLADKVKDGDIILILGAGDIRDIGPAVVESIKTAGNPV